MKELMCPNCPSFLTSTAQQAAWNNMERGYPEEVTIQCPTCRTQLSVSIEWQPVPVAAIIQPDTGASK